MGKKVSGHQPQVQMVSSPLGLDRVSGHLVQIKKVSCLQAKNALGLDALGRRGFSQRGTKVSGLQVQAQAFIPKAQAKKASDLQL